MIYVCAITKVDETISQCGAKHLLTLLSGDTQFVCPQSIATANHLLLTFNDIVEEREGLVAPGLKHVESLLRFVRQWDRSSPLVINCFAGVSRSTAAAYIAAAALSPDRAEDELAATLRRLSPTATPNLRLIRHADKLLQRKGRMISAIEAIGRGADAFEGAPFALPINAKT
jgi:predicted protein tyrosine phosphatase